MFDLKTDFSKKITKNDLNVDIFNQQDRRLVFEFGKEMKFENERVHKKALQPKMLLSCLYQLLS